MKERLQKILSQWDIASRRQAEQMILDRRVRLNGVIAQLGQKADPELDLIEVDGISLQPINRPKRLYLLMHKPAGVLSTCKDPRQRRTVLDLLPDDYRPKVSVLPESAEKSSAQVHPVGRLDIDTTGALLLTNDGELTFYLTHPRHHIPKTYQVWVQGHPPESVLQAWRDGVYLSGFPAFGPRPSARAQVEGSGRGERFAVTQASTLSSAVRPSSPRSETRNRQPMGQLTLPAQVHLLERRFGTQAQTCLQIILREGRNRQIRRVAEQLGYPVLHLHRTAVGPIRLQPEHEPELPRGHYRPLTATELKSLRALIGSLCGSNECAS